MSLECEFKPITELLSFIVDNRGKSAPTSDKGIKLIATNCIKNTSLYPLYEKVRYVTQETYNTWFRAHPQPGDIIFVNKGAPGSVCMVPDKVDFCIAQDMMAFRVDEEEIYNKYLFAFLRSPQTQSFISNYHVGTMIPHFKKTDLDKLMVPVPTMEIQRKIGDMYFLFCNKIELNNKLNANLDSLIANLFAELFDLENANYCPINQVMEVRDGTHDSPKAVDEGFPLITSKHLLKYGVNKADANKISETDYNKVNERSKVNFGDILISMIGTVGLISFVMEEKIDYAIKNVGLFKTSNNERLKYFTHSYLTSSKITNHINMCLAGSTQKYISLTELRKLPYPIFAEEEIDNFNSIVEPIYKQIKSLNDENMILIKIRDFLLPKIISGDIAL